MQYSYIHTLKRSIKDNDYLWVVKIAILFFVLIFLYKELQSSWSKGDLINLLSHKFNYDLISLIVALIPFNWGLESLKWKVLTSSLVKQSFLTCFKAVLTGLSLNQVAPMNFGDIVGRVAHLNTKQKAQGVGLLMLGSALQLSVTLFFGILGIYFIVANQIKGWNDELGFILGAVVLGVICISAVVIFKNRFLARVSPLIGKYLTALKQLTSSQITQAALLSVLRYLVFSMQFIIALYLFEISLPMTTLLAGVTWIFLVKTVVPSLNLLSDLGLREFSALYFFAFYDVPEISVAAATLLIWLLNVILPSVFGAFFILGIKRTSK